MSILTRIARLERWREAIDREAILDAADHGADLKKSWS